MVKNIDLQHPVYIWTGKIPKGKVATYGQIAAKCKIHPRQVGYILHHNPNPDLIPCHRVVNFQGKTAKNFAFGFADAQRQLLESEGVIFADNKVPLSKYLYDL